MPRCRNRPIDRSGSNAWSGGGQEEENRRSLIFTINLAYVGRLRPAHDYAAAGYERTKSGIAVGEDLTTEHWRPAKTRYDSTKY